MNLEQWIADLPLAELPILPITKTAGGPLLRSLQLNTARQSPASINAGSLLSFVDGISAQQRDDVLYSTQFAQRAASAAHDRFRAPAAWYGKYMEVLGQLGWVSEQLAFARAAQKQQELRLDKAALQVIAAIASQNQLLVLQKAIGALEAMADGNSLQLFELCSQHNGNGNFQLGSVQRSENGALAMAAGAFHFSSSDQRRRFLFLQWGEQQMQLWMAAQKLTLNTSHYAPLREVVRQQLGERARGYILDLPLAD